MINITIFCLPQIEMSVESEPKKRKRCYVCPTVTFSTTQIICYKCRKHICQHNARLSSTEAVPADRYYKGHFDQTEKGRLVYTSNHS
ncbi:hypothetical protein LAZ67_7001383 [Cordylochernes scorpioides]|uniref:PiggyBac transposable element-derived protein 4 C-terminal zinc-ribbon domain-containing protein n=1 Tax=Cordylochernes scorpioides TaxID=51811 RepID=A0ABY6KMA7_9ARAC|nr:hypothetical protein LAZ67_7001383 [Cordylochernes scorpioides]